MPDPVPLPIAGTPPPSSWCLCVKIGGQWKRAVTVSGSDQLEAFERAKAQLPESLRDKPMMFRASSLCPDGNDAGKPPSA